MRRNAARVQKRARVSSLRPALLTRLWTQLCRHCWQHHDCTRWRTRWRRRGLKLVQLQAQTRHERAGIWCFLTRYVRVRLRSSHTDPTTALATTKGNVFGHRPTRLLSCTASTGTRPSERSAVGGWECGAGGAPLGPGPSRNCYLASTEGSPDRRKSGAEAHHCVNVVVLLSSPRLLRGASQAKRRGPCLTATNATSTPGMTRARCPCCHHARAFRVRAQARAAASALEVALSRERKLGGKVDSMELYLVLGRMFLRLSQAAAPLAPGIARGVLIWLSSADATLFPSSLTSSASSRSGRHHGQGTFRRRSPQRRACRKGCASLRRARALLPPIHPRPPGEAVAGALVTHTRSECWAGAGAMVSQRQVQHFAPSSGGTPWHDPAAEPFTCTSHAWPRQRRWRRAGSPLALQGSGGWGRWAAAVL